MDHQPTIQPMTARLKRLPYLKKANMVFIGSFICANLVVFLSVYLHKQFASSSVEHYWKHVTAKGGIVAACLPVGIIILSGLFGDLGKARLVFWRWRDPLPGCRVFSELLATDPRINVQVLKDR